MIWSVIVLFHSMFGLRAVELAAADRLRAVGHRVVVPDLFDGASVPGDLDAGFALMDHVGWSTIVDRALRSVRHVPDDAVMGGFSMGVGVIGAIWPQRISAAGVFCLHAATTVPEKVSAGTPVQLHVATDDRFAPPSEIAAFNASATRAGATASVHQYSGAGHFYTDPTLPDYDAAAAAATWGHVSQLTRVSQ